MEAGSYDVAVIGCGPVGVLAANLLGQAGLTTIIIEKEVEVVPYPRAVHMDHEAMRLLQRVGVAELLLPRVREADGHLHVGADGGVIRYMGTAGQPRPYGWANDYFFYQPELEQCLRDNAAGFSNIRLFLGAVVEGLDQGTDGVTLAVRTSAGTESVRASWAIACDGARSMVRKELGIGLDDLDFDEPWLVVDAEVDGAIRFPEIGGVAPNADLQRLSVMICDPARPATIVPGRGKHRRWEFMLLPGESDEEMMQPEVVRRLMAPWLGATPHRMIRATTYRFHGLVAAQWRVGRVFLAGDAAHQTPPFFGQGMCHGFRDVANLAWKLVAVAGGQASADILESYQCERDPHVREIIGTSLEAGRYICILDPEVAAARDRRLRAMAGKAPQPVAELIPRIRDGIIAHGTPAAGERFIQPWIDEGSGRRLLDDSYHAPWRLFVTTQTESDAARSLVRAASPQITIQIVAAEGVADAGAITAWLKARQVSAALVRPDFYVFGGAANRERLVELLTSLAAALWGGGSAAGRFEKVTAR